jgi:TRAP-type C4-dicarboxylate transport system permease small subunit
MRQIKKLVYSIDEIIASLVLAFIILLTVSGVFFRYILHQPIAWQEELSTVAMVWLVFMGSSVVAKRSAHIRIDTLANSLPQAYQQIWLLMVNLLVFLVLGLVLYYSAKLSWQTVSFWQGCKSLKSLQRHFLRGPAGRTAQPFLAA